VDLERRRSGRPLVGGLDYGCRFVLGDHGKLWEIGDSLERDRWIGSRFDSGSLWDEHAF
jgi:hypothetical protein